MMGDLISRKALCDDLREYKVHPVPISSDESEVKGYNDGIDLAISVIAEFPSAESVRKWIPFEVALPNDRQKVLCVNKHDEMMVGGYMSDYGMTFPCYFEKPIAWMPLPEPWRGEE